MITVADVVTVDVPKKFDKFADAVVEHRAPTIAASDFRRDRVQLRSLGDVRFHTHVGTVGELVSSRWVGPEAYRDAATRLSDTRSTFDGGIDFRFSHGFVFDAKSTRSESGITLEEALFGIGRASNKGPFHLQPLCRIDPDTVYIMVFIDHDGRHAHLVGWHYGHDLQSQWNGSCPWMNLRPMNELRDDIDRAFAG